MAWLFAQTRAGGPRDPRRAGALLERLAVPMPDRVVRVVGTNGKGTVATMLAAGLSAAGHRTGRFLSPHVESFTERVAIDGVEVSPAQVLAFVRRARAASTVGGVLHDLPVDLLPAFFEWTLALALERFALAGVDYAVLEAGVGGAGDATSAVVRRRGGSDGTEAATAPDRGGGNVALVVVTNVDLDHVETLGRTVEEIAAEKAGAIAPGAPAVTGATGAALDVIAALARARGADLHVDSPDDPLFEPPPHQASRSGPSGTRRANARLAAAGLRLLGVVEPAVAAAMAVPALPGRGERFEVAGRDVLLDGAHDPAAAARLVSELERGYVLVFGSLARKQSLATLAVLAAGASAVVVTEAQAGDGLVRYESPGRRLVRDPSAALDLALELAGPDGRVVIAGSLYLAGRLRPLLHSRTA